MLFRFFAYLKYLYRSKNQHGVHSPFVYDFVTKGLYASLTETNLNIDLINSFHLHKREEKILINILVYFDLFDRIKEVNSVTNTLYKSYNYLYINSLCDFNITEIQMQSGMHGIQTIILRKPYANVASEEKWKKIIQMPSATVTIDLFYFGLVFFRKEQRKEHFVIRV